MGTYRKKVIAISMFFLSLTAVLYNNFTSANLSVSSKEESFVKGRVLVQLKAGEDKAKLDEALVNLRGKAIDRIEKINVHVVQVPEGAEEQVVTALSHNPMVNLAQLDRKYKPSMVTNDPMLGNEWHIAQTSVPAAWDITTGSGITVAILDTGVEATHPEFVGKIVPGWNTYNNNSDTADILGHGTNTAGTVAAQGNNGIGVVGVAFNAKIMPIRISDSTGWATSSSASNGIIWAIDHGAKVANVSFDLARDSIVQNAATYMKNKGGVVVISAGNNAQNYTTAYSGSIVVSATQDSSDTFSTWSNYGNAVDISAPGYNIRTTGPNGTYWNCWGTSFSAPIVSGTVALMMAANPLLSPSQIESLLISTAKDLGTAGYDIYYGHGRVNTGAAVAAAAAAVSQDTLAPSVSISSLANGSVVKGLVTVSVLANDNVAVSRVELYVGSSLLSTDSLAPYAFSFDSTKVADGNVTLMAKAFDSSGNSATSSVSVVVDNIVDTQAPVINIISPTANSVIKSSVSISASATDNEKVASLSVYIDGVLKTKVSASSVSYSWNTRKVSSGVHTIRIDAKDASGNLASKSIQVTK